MSAEIGSDCCPGRGPVRPERSRSAWLEPAATIGEDTFDGTECTGETTGYTWAQVAGTPVTLTGADTAEPPFTAPGTSGPLSFKLTVTGPGGSSTDSVSVAPKPDPLTAAARCRTGTKQWIVTGTATSLSPANTVTVHDGLTLSGPVIGSPAAVNAVTAPGRSG